MTTPDSLKYTKEHEWIRIDGRIATIGITDYAQHELGDIVYVTLPEPGTPVRQMAVFGTVEAVKTVSDLFSPVTGKVVEANHALQTTPEIVNSSPYEKGWMIKVEMTDPNEIEGLLSPQAYRQQIGEMA
jgi:glycine cleavage system H protein